MKGKTNNILLETNASIDVDKELYSEDIDASIIHCKMLAKQGVIPTKISKKIVNCLEKLEKKLKVKNLNSIKNMRIFI